LRSLQMLRPSRNNCLTCWISSFWKSHFFRAVFSDATPPMTINQVAPNCGSVEPLSELDAEPCPNPDGFYFLNVICTRDASSKRKKVFAPYFFSSLFKDPLPALVNGAIYFSEASFPSACYGPFPCGNDPGTVRWWHLFFCFWIFLFFAGNHVPLFEPHPGRNVRFWREHWATIEKAKRCCCLRRVFCDSNDWKRVIKIKVHCSLPVVANCKHIERTKSKTAHCARAITKLTNGIRKKRDRDNCLSPIPVERFDIRFFSKQKNEFFFSSNLPPCKEKSFGCSNVSNVERANPLSVVKT